MRIGIDASRAFLKNRTGIEEHSYQVITHLIEELKNHEVVLYVKKNQKSNLENRNCKDIKIKEIKFYRFWTQIGLAFEMLLNPVDILFVPAHVVPWIHPKKTLVTVHGLEYENCPESYSFWSRWLHRFFIKKSCAWAKRIIAVSRKTKADLVKLYQVPKSKIKVVYNGYSEKETRYKKQDARKISNYLLYIGRLEKRKNIENIIKAFRILKEKYNYSGKLFLAGRPGYKYNKIRNKIQETRYKNFIIEKGFINNQEKWQLMRRADVFLFPSLCEGFGIPILEAQSAGVPVITSNFGPMDEVAGDKNILVNPKKPEAMAILTNRLINDRIFRQRIIKKGLQNIKKFSWQKSGKEVKDILKNL